MLLLPAAACLGADRIDVTLERLADDKWNRIDTQTVVNKGERVRFRFVSASPGWLAVYYVGSGGQSEWLSPSQLVVKDNAVVVPPDPTALRYHVAVTFSPWDPWVIPADFSEDINHE